MTERPRTIPAELRAMALAMARKVKARLPANIDRFDIEQAALFGLWDGMTKACRRDIDWQTAGGMSYLRCRIRGAIIDELRAQDWLPRRARFATDPTRIPVIVRMGDLATIWPEGFEATLPATGESPEETASSRSLVAAAWAARALSARELFILRRHYQRGAKFKDIGRELNVSEARVSQLHARAMATIRRHLGAGDEIGDTTAHANHTHLDRTPRDAASGTRPQAIDHDGIRRGRLGAPPAASPHRASPRGGRDNEPRRGASASRCGATRGESEPEPAWF